MVVAWPPSTQSIDSHIRSKPSRGVHNAGHYLYRRTRRKIWMTVTTMARAATWSSPAMPMGADIMMFGLFVESYSPCFMIYLPPVNHDILKCSDNCLLSASLTFQLAAYTDIHH
ncbi:hypothetical protein VPH35_081990 [Triticum aestivum]